MKIKYRQDRTNARLIWDILDEEISMSGEKPDAETAETIAAKRGLNPGQVKTELSAWKKARLEMARILAE